MFGFEFIVAMADRCRAELPFAELAGDDGGPYRSLRRDGTGEDAGFVRVWRADGTLADRMVHVRLRGEPVDTQLFFMFGRTDTPMPHFHAQVVQFAPDACVFNADFLPRLDPVDHPGYFELAFAALNKPYWKAINDPQNACAQAPISPMIALYLTPWSIGVSRPTDRAELERVTPQIEAFRAHATRLATTLEFSGADAAQLRRRNERHLERFFSDDIDPRAWRGVYGLIGDAAGHDIKSILTSPLAERQSNTARTD